MARRNGCAAAVGILLLTGLAGCIDDGPVRMRHVLGSLEWRPGPLEIQGRVTAVREVDGQTWLGLDNSWRASAGDLCGGVLVPQGTYAVGDRWQGTLVFEEGTWDGIPMVWSPQLPCPFPSMADAIGSVLESVSWVLGGAWVPSDTQPNTFNVLVRRGQSFDPGPLQIHALERIWQGVPDTEAWISSDQERTWDGGRIDSFQDWTEALSWLFVDVSEWSDTTDGGTLGHVLAEERLRRLGAPMGFDGTGGPATVAWDDAQADGLLGTGDRLRFEMPPRPGAWHTVLFVESSCLVPDCPGGLHLMLWAPDGTLRSTPPDMLVPFIVDPATLSPASGEGHVVVGQVFGNPPAVDDLRVRWGQGTATNDEAALREQRSGSGQGLTWAYEDDGDHMVGSGDVLRVAWERPAALQVLHVPSNTQLDVLEFGDLYADG